MKQQDQHYQVTQRRQAFTLLEIIIVLTVLAVVCWRVVPDLTRAAGDDREARLVNALQLLRSQLDYYQQQHNGEYPCGSPGAPVDANLFMRRLTMKTDMRHGPDGRFGPYLYAIPVNPFNQKNTVRYISQGGEKGTNEAGWAFELQTGTIYPDDAQQTLDGMVPHRDY
jgi:prepilin-type N-terminal cleavage/methylation domain-containing protein